MPPAPATVAAIVTPPGEGGIGVIQVVGAHAIGIVDGLFEPGRGVHLSQCPPGRLLYGRIVAEGHVLDEVIAAACCPEEGPTGEPTVEINCHGGIAALRAVLDCVVARGAAKATWQVILSRATTTGRLDAVQAEAARLLATAYSPLAAGVLLDQYRGALSRALEAAARLFDAGDLHQASSMLDQLLATAGLGLALVQPRRVVIAGSPNVGKSTLFNAMVGHPRVIVADVPGTTRDAVAEIVVLEGIPFELTDTAGLRDTDHIVEIESVKGTWRRLAEADVVVLLFDGTRPVEPEEWRVVGDIRTAQVLPAISKCDCPQRADAADVARRCSAEPYRICAMTGEGLELLEARIVETIPGRAGYRPGTAVVFTPRQREAIWNALQPPPQRAAQLLRHCLRSGEPS